MEISTKVNFAMVTGKEKELTLGLTRVIIEDSGWLIR